jgi:hypothetical protein
MAFVFVLLAASNSASTALSSLCYSTKAEIQPSSRRFLSSRSTIQGDVIVNAATFLLMLSLNLAAHTLLQFSLSTTSLAVFRGHTLLK